MDLTASLHPNPKGWLLNSVLAPHVDAFAEYLRQGRYSASTASRYLGSIARLTSQSYLPVEMLTENAVEQFLGNHLPRCDCPAPVVRVLGDLRAACGHLLRLDFLSVRAIRLNRPAIRRQ